MDRINNINKITRVKSDLNIHENTINLDFKDIEERVEKQIGEFENLAEIKTYIKEDDIEISHIGRKVTNEIKKMEVNFRDVIFASLSIENKLENIDFLIKNLEFINKDIDRINYIFKNLDIVENKKEIAIVLKETEIIIKEILYFSNKEVKNNSNLIKLFKSYEEGKEEDRESLKDHNIDNKSEKIKFHIGENNEKFYKIISLEIDSFKDFIEKLKEFLRYIRSKNKLSLTDKDIIGQQMKKLENRLIKIVEECARERTIFLELIEKNENYKNLIREDYFFKKFLLGDNIDFEEQIISLLVAERKKEYEKIEEENISSRREYREGRKDLGYILENIEKIFHKNLSLKEIIILLILIFFLITIINRIL